MFFIRVGFVLLPAASIDDLMRSERYYVISKRLSESYAVDGHVKFH